MQTHLHRHSHESLPIKNIRRALILNFVFVILEFAGAFYSGSVAIYANAIHDLGDSLTLFLAWGLEWLSLRGRTPRFTYGYSRLSLASSLVVSGALIVGSIFVVWHSVESYGQRLELRPQIMLPLAGLGILFNGWAYLFLRRGQSFNEKALSLHLLEDLLGWLAVAGLAIGLFFVNVGWLDPLLATGIALFTLANAVRNILASSNIFLQAHPIGFDQEAYLAKVRALPEVTATHDVHVWSMDGHHHVISYHVQVLPDLSLNQTMKVKEKCRQLLHEFGHFHCTIETEPAHTKCQDNCDPC